MLFQSEARNLKTQMAVEGQMTKDFAPRKTKKEVKVDIIIWDWKEEVEKIN